MRKRSLYDWWDEYYDNVPRLENIWDDCLGRMAWVEVPEAYEDCYDIRDRYEAAMSKRSDYVCRDLAEHLYYYGVAYCPDPQEGSVLVGCKETAEKYGIFVVSHFAPASRKGGVEMLKAGARAGFPVIFAVPDNLAQQLVRLGYRNTEVTIPQWFAGEYVTKTVVVNQAATKEDLMALKEHFNV